MAICDLTADDVRQLLDYDSATGIFRWRVRPLHMFKDARSCGAWNGRYANKRAGGISNGYASVRIHDRAYFLHRVAWLLSTGQWPLGEIDHINGLKTDNRIANLRDVPGSVNHENVRKRPAGGSNLPLGVHFLRRKVVRRYSASLRIAGRATHLGYFSTPEEAHAAYVRAKRVHHVGCTI